MWRLTHPYSWFLVYLGKPNEQADEIIEKIIQDKIEPKEGWSPHSTKFEVNGTTVRVWTANFPSGYGDVMLSGASVCISPMMRHALKKYLTDMDKAKVKSQIEELHSTVKGTS